MSITSLSRIAVLFIAFGMVYYAAVNLDRHHPDVSADVMLVKVNPEEVSSYAVTENLKP